MNTRDTKFQSVVATNLQFKKGMGWGRGGPITETKTTTTKILSIFNVCYKKHFFSIAPSMGNCKLMTGGL